MILLYSGAASDSAIQQQPYLSLGGYVSATQVRNGVKNSVFEDASLADIKNKKAQFRLLVLKNTTGINKTGVTIYTVKDVNTAFKYTIALVLPTTDSCGKDLFEKLISDTDMPYNGTFVNAEGSINQQTFNLLNDKTIGIWIKREVDTSNVIYFDANGNFNVNTCQMLIDAQTHPDNFYNDKDENFSLNIQYA